MLTETQRTQVQWILILVIVVCVTRLIWIVGTHIKRKREYNRYADEFFKKIEEYRNVFN
jgi:NhaP-type Na+/H+ or K+/H+ antiporter